MTGNAWQWVADWYGFDHFREQSKTEKVIENPKGPAQSYDPDDGGVAGRRTQARHARRLVPVQRRLLPVAIARARGAAPIHTTRCRTSAFDS